MDRDQVIKELLAGVAAKSTAARLRVVFPEIDRRLREGVRHEDIVATLNANGVPVSLGTFRKTLYRWRGAARRLASETVPSVAAKVVPLRVPLSAGPAAAPPEAPVRDRPDLDSVLERARRNDIGDEYLARGRPLFRKSKQEDET